MPAHPTIAFLGTGLMGLHQARNLLRAGYPLTAWNRTRARAEALAPDGARVVDTAAEAVDEADIVVLMLENGPIVEQVLFRPGVAEALRPGPIVVDMSSIKPAEAQDTRAGWPSAASPMSMPRSPAAPWAPRTARSPSWPAARVPISPGSSRSCA